MTRVFCCVIVLAATATGCCKSKTESKPPSEKPGNITITTGADGGVRVTGGAKMTGDPKDCAAFEACCKAPEAGLFCGLTKASVKDCATALASARSFLKEQNAKVPAGCM